MNEEEARLRAKAQREGDELATTQLDEDLRAVMRTGPGRRFVWNLVFHRCHLQGICTTSDSFVQGLDAGERRIGADVLEDVQRVAPHEWLQSMEELRKELLEREQQEKKQARSLEDDDQG